MTWGVDKRSADETTTAKDMHTGLDPGRGVRLPPATAPGVTDDYIKGKDPCTADPDGAGCFLDGVVRDRLVRSYQARVDSAHVEYVAALIDLRVDELLKHEDSDVGWVVGLILSLAAGYITSLIGGACRLLMQLNTTERAAAVAAIGPTKPITAAFTIEKNIDAMMSNLAGTARAYGIPAAGASKIQPAMEEHGQVVSFIDIMKSQAAILFQGMREGPIASSSDEPLIAMWLGMDARRGHTSGHYKTMLAAEIEKFKASRASWIGKRNATFDSFVNLVDKDTPHTYKTPGELQTRVVWLTRLADHGVPRLCYFDDRQTARWGPLRGQRDIDEFAFAASVEPEFVDVAIERHRQAWGEDPKAMVIDDRDPENIRMLVDPFSGQGVPRLQLGGKS